MTPPLPDTSGGPDRAEHGDGSLTTRTRSASLRRWVAAVLVVIAALGAVGSVIGVWAARTALDTDRWVTTVAPLPQDPQVADAVSTYVTGEVVRLIDVEQRIATALPPAAAFLAGPVAGTVRDDVQDVVDDVLQTPQFQSVWIGVNRRAHEQIVAVLDDRSTTVQSGDGRVTLNLLPVVNNVLGALEEQAPTLLGNDIDLPEITDGEVPPGLQSRIEAAVGRQLPADVSEITIYRADEVGAVQDAVRAARQYLGLLVVGSVVALVLAVWVSPGRRRTLLQLGVWLVLATTALASLLRVVRDQVLADLPAGVYRDGAASAWTIVFDGLRDRAGQVLWVGVVVVLVAYLAGPGRGPRRVRQQVVSIRRAAADGGRWLLDASRGGVWTRDTLDLLRIGGVGVAVVVALVLSSETSLLVVLVALALYQSVLTLLARRATPADGRARPETVGLPEQRPAEQEPDQESTPSTT
jgi:hypothetical protein